MEKKYQREGIVSRISKVEWERIKMESFKIHKKASLHYCESCKTGAQSFVSLNTFGEKARARIGHDARWRATFHYSIVSFSSSELYTSSVREVFVSVKGGGSILSKGGGSILSIVNQSVCSSNKKAS